MQHVNNVTMISGSTKADNLKQAKELVKGEVMKNQDDVDDLLSTLGF